MSVATQISLDSEMSGMGCYAPVGLSPAPTFPTALTRGPERLATVAVLNRAQTPAVAAPLRLTRRGVLVLVLTVAALGSAVLWLAARSAPASTPSPPAPHTVDVQPGDTLWSIASALAPRRDPRAEIAALQRRNHLTDTDLAPGQRLLVP